MVIPDESPQPKEVVENGTSIQWENLPKVRELEGTPPDRDFIQRGKRMFMSRDMNFSSTLLRTCQQTQVSPTELGVTAIRSSPQLRTLQHHGKGGNDEMVIPKKRKEK